MSNNCARIGGRIRSIAGRRLGSMRAAASSSAPAPTILLDLPLHNSGSCYSDNGVTPAGDGDTVYLWQQSIDGVNAFEQATAGSRPYYRTGGIETNGDQRYMTLSGQPNLPALGTEIVFYAYVDVPADPGEGCFPLGSTSFGLMYFQTQHNTVMVMFGESGGGVQYSSVGPGTGLKLFRVRILANGTGKVTWTGKGDEAVMDSAVTDPSLASFDTILRTVEETEGTYWFHSPDGMLVRAVRIATGMVAATMASYETTTSGAALTAPT